MRGYFVIFFLIMNNEKLKIIINLIKKFYKMKRILFSLKWNKKKILSTYDSKNLFICYDSFVPQLLLVINI